MKPRTTSCPKFSEALIAADEAGEIKITDETVGRAFNRGDDTGGRIRRGEYDALVERMRNALFTPIGRPLLETLFCNTPYGFIERSPSTDLDGDGVVNKGDVLVGAIQATKSLGAQLEAIQSAAPGRLYTPAESADIRRHIHEAISTLQRTCAAVQQCSITGVS